MKHDSNNDRRHDPEGIEGLISRYRKSGLGLERFAREQGIPATRLHYWVYQKSRSQARKSWRGVRSPVFQEVKMAAGLPAMQTWVAEISLAKGLAIRFSAEAKPSWIGLVVEALQRPC